MCRSYISAEFVPKDLAIISLGSIIWSELYARFED